MAEEAAQVAQRCEQARASSELLLNGCGLRKFPDAVFFLMRDVELEKVNLSHNELIKIPPKLTLKFASITELDLSHNKLTSLPEEFTNFNKLVVVDLRKNEFQTFPKVLWRLSTLTVANLSSNMITEVSREGYSSTQCLETLDLKDNPLQPEEQAFLQSIVRFQVIL